MQTHRTVITLEACTLHKSVSIKSFSAQLSGQNQHWVLTPCPMSLTHVTLSGVVDKHLLVREHRTLDSFVHN